MPTTCFNCESACGLRRLPSINESGEIRKFEGNPATPRQLVAATAPRARRRSTRSMTPERILYPLKPGRGTRRRRQWERVSLGRSALRGHRRDGSEHRHPSRVGTTSVMYHVGRPGEDGFMDRDAQGVGCRRPQQPYEPLLVGTRGPATPELDGARPSVSSDFANAKVHPADLVEPPRDRSLFQPARPADHRGPSQAGAKLATM